MVNARPNVLATAHCVGTTNRQLLEQRPNDSVRPTPLVRLGGHGRTGVPALACPILHSVPAARLHTHHLVPVDSAVYLSFFACGLANLLQASKSFCCSVVPRAISAAVPLCPLGMKPLGTTPPEAVWAMAVVVLAVPASPAIPKPVCRGFCPQLSPTVWGTCRDTGVPSSEGSPVAQWQKLCQLGGR